LLARNCFRLGALLIPSRTTERIEYYGKEVWNLCSQKRSKHPSKIGGRFRWDLCP
jgi:hypothetical protein